MVSIQFLGSPFKVHFESILLFRVLDCPRLDLQIGWWVDISSDSHNSDSNLKVEWMLMIGTLSYIVRKHDGW